MTKDELKKKLKSAWTVHKMLESNFAVLQNLDDIANNITPAYSMAPGGSGNGQKLENAIVKKADLEMAIREEYEQLVESLREVRSLIKLVDDPMQRLILQKRYLNYQKWEVIAADLGYSWRQVHRLHGNGLNVIFKKMA